MDQWYLYCKKADFYAISEKFNISPMLARIIRNRGIVSDDEIDAYLNGGLERLHDPFLLKGMQEAVVLTKEAILSHRKIRIIGDYDVDGICSSYILKTFISKAGGDCDVRLPDRLLEGYGMNEEMVRECKEDGISLIITCDNGVSSFDAVKLARSFGIDCIITDHHEVPENVPDANIIIDPKQKDCPYPFKEICGAGVAYKFVQALNRYMNLNEACLLDSLLQFAGMATIADIVPLIDENRVLAKEGIKRLKNTDNLGLNKLFSARELEKAYLESYHVSFIISPCINSAGRLKNAILAYNLLEENDEFVAEEIANGLCMLNEERKELTNKQSIAAEKFIEDSKREDGLIEKVLVVFLPDAHESVAGIIAGRLKDKYNRPTLVITNSEDGLKGSGRSINQYNLIEELKRHSELFQKFGGHAKACGFTLKQNGTDWETVKKISDSLNADCRLDENDFINKIWIDIQLPFRYITEEFVNELKKLEPFGTANEKPVFAEKNVFVSQAMIIGKNNNLLKLKMTGPDGTTIDGLIFGSEENTKKSYEEISRAHYISILYYPDINYYRDMATPQAIIKAYKINQ